MKAWLSLGLCVVAVMGVVATQADAAIELTVRAELAPGFTGQVSAADPNVWFNVYAYFGGANGSYLDDGISTVMGALKSSTGRMLGDLSFTLRDPNFTMGAGGPSSGTIQDLDGDTDMDVGSPVAGAQVGWIVANVAGGAYQQEADSNRILIGTALFHANTFTDSTVVSWSFRPKTTNPKVMSYKLDGTARLVLGTDAVLGVDPGVTLVPEPMTLALLAAGGTGLLAFRKRRKTA